MIRVLKQIPSGYFLTFENSSKGLNVRVEKKEGIGIKLAQAVLSEEGQTDIQIERVVETLVENVKRLR